MCPGGAASFMSIINDALKKVQTNLDQNNSTPTKNTMTTPPPENSQPNNFSEPSPQPKPDYDHNLGKPAAPWDIPAAQTIINPTPQAEPPKEAVKKQTAPRVEEKKSSRLTPVVIILLLIFATAIFTLKKNEKILAEHNIHLRLPEKIQKIFSANIFSQKTQAPGSLTAAAAVAQKDELVVNAVMLQGSKHIALINDKIYNVGDSINGMKILKINFQEMVVQDGEKEKRLRS